MNRAERERLIERYLNGEMTSSEEHDLFIEVAVDRELRTELKAYRTVESAIRKDGAASPSYTALRGRVQASLQGTAVPGGASAGSAAAPTAATGILKGVAAVKWIVAAGAAASLSLAVLLVQPGAERGAEPSPDAGTPHILREVPRPASSQPPVVGGAEESDRDGEMVPRPASVPREALEPGTKNVSGSDRTKPSGAQASEADRREKGGGDTGAASASGGRRREWLKRSDDSTVRIGIEYMQPRPLN